MELPPPAESTNPHLCKRFDELFKVVANLNVSPNWRISFCNILHIFQKDEVHEIPLFDVYFSNKINFIIRVFAWCLPTDHDKYKK